MDRQIIRYYQGELSAAERIRLLRLAVSDEQVKKLFIRHHNLHALLNLAPQDGDREQAVAACDGFIRERLRLARRRRLVHTLRYAAAILCLVVGTWMAAGIYFSESDRPADAVMINTLSVPAGQRVSLTLPDGTLVWLNAQSVLTWPAVFAGNERRIGIEGEAFLQVAKDAERPFIVSSLGVDIRVTGTTFNLYRYPGEADSRISLLEGSLQVIMPGSAAGSVTLRPNEEVLIHDRTMKTGRIPGNDRFLWKEGIYSFENERFEHIVRKLEQYYDVAIDVRDAEMLRWRYTVKFRQRDGIDVILHLMQRIKRFRVEKDGENNRITIRK
jgi:ferric-dicitrate binding protein FerR (iron transport regulator)